MTDLPPCEMLELPVLPAGSPELVLEVPGDVAPLTAPVPLTPLEPVPPVPEAEPPALPPAPAPPAPPPAPPPAAATPATMPMTIKAAISGVRISTLILPPVMAWTARSRRAAIEPTGPGMALFRDRGFSRCR
ncbi:hypothetical protein CCS92_25525 [Methylobacterium radiotolerans]|nr:hypothetical protein CCS92_25525 [Methylobacterium radiotolerans]